MDLKLSEHFEQAIKPGYAAISAAWRELELRGDISLHRIQLTNPRYELMYADIRPEHPRQIFIGAGVHGDEPVSPWALVSMVRDGLLDERFGYRLWLCTNPSGFDLGTRCNDAGLDINRSYGSGLKTDESAAIMAATAGRRYELAIDLHEDFEGDGFYLYEPIVANSTPFGRPVLDAMEEAGFPIQMLSEQFDLGYPDDCAHHMRTLERGRVIPNVEAERAFFRDGLPLTMFLLDDIAERTLTFETPRRSLWDDRIAMHRIAVVTALDVLTKPV